jgi:hypothetical protein
MCRGRLRSVLPSPLANALPISTDGPSGPRLAPVPRLMAAATVFTSGLATCKPTMLLRSEVKAREVGRL